MSQVAVKKTRDAPEAGDRRARPAAEPAPQAGVPGFLGGVAAGGGMPAFLQRQPMDIIEEAEPEEAGPSALAQRLPQDPFPSGEDEEADAEGAALVQPKLDINAPGDAFEKEADGVAAAVTGGPAAGPPAARGAAPAVQRKCATCGGAAQADGAPCPDCAKKLQRSETGAGGGDGKTAADAVSNPGAGRAIPDATRRPIEAELGRDLSGVQVHDGPEAAEAAASINAKAFTHRNHIWLGQGQSSSDTALMAHEATHTVQQNERGTAASLVQRAPADHQHPEDGAGQKRVFERMLGSEDAASPDEARRPSEVDDDERQEKREELEEDLPPKPDRAAEVQPTVQAATSKVQSEADAPPEPLVEGNAEEPDAEDAAEAEAPAAADPVAEAEAAIASLPEPEAPVPVVAPEIAQPVDADGEPLPPESQPEAMVQGLAAELQLARQHAFNLRQRSRVQKANAIILRGNIAFGRQKIAESEANMETAHGNMEVRRQAISEAENAHATSEEKADQVASEAPGIEEEAQEGRDESGPMASEASDSSAQAAENEPADDPEAAEKTRETGGKMNEVAGDASTMDSASTEAVNRAVQLQEDAAGAKAGNASAMASIDAATASADETDAKLVELDETNTKATADLDPHSATPDASEAEAQRLDDAAVQADAQTDELSVELERVQHSYISDMARVPGAASLSEQNDGQIQRSEGEEAPAAAPEAAFLPRGYEGRHKVEFPTFQIGPPLTEEQRQERADAAARAEARRQARIRALRERTEANFDQLDAFDKAGIALDYMMEDAFAGVGNIKLPSWEGAGRAFLNILDPRGPINGIMGGLSMIASGGLNLFDMGQWARDPLGNLLKSAADIATGLTLILGSIAGLLGIATVLLAIGSFFFPALLPALAWCTNATITVSGWTVVVGLLALNYQGLLIIKNIVDVMTAETADELVQNTEQLEADFSQAGQIGMQVGSAALGATGARMPVSGLGPGTAARAAAQTAARGEVRGALEGAVIEAAAGEDIGGVVNLGRGAVGHVRGSGGGGDGPTARAGEGEGAAAPRADAGDGATAGDAAAAPRPEADVDAPAPSAERRSEPADGPPPDAPVPNSQLSLDRGRPPELVEGGPAQPSRELDTRVPETPETRPDAEADAGAPRQEGEGDTAAADGAEAGADGGPEGGGLPDSGAVTPPVDAPSNVPGARRGPEPGDAAGGTPRPAGDGGAEAPAARPESDAEGAAPRDGADARPARGESESPAALREASAGKTLDEMTPQQRQAESDAVNDAPKQEVTDPALREAGFDERVEIDNGREFLRSEEMGASCRLANTVCPGNNGNNTTNLSNAENVDARDALAGSGRDPHADGAEGDAPAPRQGEGAEPQPRAEEGDVETTAAEAGPEPDRSASDDAPSAGEGPARQIAPETGDRLADTRATEGHDVADARQRLEQNGYRAIERNGEIVGFEPRPGAESGLPRITVEGGKVKSVDPTEHVRTMETFNADGDRVNRSTVIIDPATGRPKRVEAVLTHDLGGHTRNDPATEVGKEFGDPTAGDHGGHLIAHRFMSDTIPEGIVPQQGNLNTGAWKRMENEIAATIKYAQDMGASIELRMTVDVKPPGARRPDSLDGRWSAEIRYPDGRVETFAGGKEFPNQAGQSYDRIRYRRSGGKYVGVRYDPGDER